jgi:hypothetical protein
MFELFTPASLAIFFRLVMAHLLGDFIIQPNSWLKQKSEKKWTSGWLYLHGILSGVLIYVFSGFWTVIWLPITIFISHVLLDGIKIKFEDTTRVFLLDQLGHFIVILICWLLLVNANLSNIDIFLFLLSVDPKFWFLILAYIVVFWPTGVFIGKIVEPWRKEIQIKGLEQAGLWIGRLERILILTFVLLNHFEAIGFLIAAKSVFRFGEIRGSDGRKETEYFLIGTMISFIIAITLGVVSSWFSR